MINYIQTSHRFKRDVEALRKNHLPIQNIKVAVHHIIMENNNLLHKSYDDHALSGNLPSFAVTGQNARYFSTEMNDRSDGL